MKYKILHEIIFFLILYIYNNMLLLWLGTLTSSLL